MHDDKRKIVRNVISTEEYLRRRRMFQRENKSEPETYSFEVSSDSFLKSLVKIVNP